MDKTDAQILKVLSKDARTSFLGVAREVVSDLEDSTIRKRALALEKKGIIRKYTILLNVEKIPAILAVAIVSVNPAKLKESLKHFSAVENVSQIFYELSGTVLCFLSASSEEKMADVLKEVYEVPGVQKIRLLSNLRVGKHESLIAPNVIDEIARAEK